MLTALATLVVGVAGCVSQRFCDKEARCNDESGGDFQQVCVAKYEGALRALEANKEPECRALSLAQQAFDLCLLGLECPDFVRDDPSNVCLEQRRARDAAQRTAGDNCTTDD